MFGTLYAPEVAPRLAAAPGRLIVAWFRPHPTRFDGSRSLVLAERRGSRWSTRVLTPALVQDLCALVMSDGRPTVLGISHGTGRLYAITVSTGSQ